MTELPLCLLPLAVAVLAFAGAKLWVWLERRRKVTITMQPERAVDFEPGQEILLQGGEFISKPLRVLHVDREKGVITLG